MHAEKPSPYRGGNSLLSLLSAATARAIVEDADTVSFSSGNVVRASQGTLEHVYFPLDMTIARSMRMQDRAEVSVGAVGREGMCGAELVLGVDRTPARAICQISGSAVRIPAGAFVRNLERSPGARAIALRYVRAEIGSLETSIACNAAHPVTARRARWFLAAQDRVRSDEFAVTRESLATIVDLHGESVAAVSEGLEEQGAVAYADGRVRIVDREKLERAACDCYRLNIDRYAELLDNY
ncbi:MAG: Crp/Fnr family transcriptional regulator [Candidatus Eremiobacteraeota bacterium]|nr:Crp/Fnr family transcriptional regulator [Candidatus Eremiobacteraeota bacterium]